DRLALAQQFQLPQRQLAVVGAATIQTDGKQQGNPAQAQAVDQGGVELRHRETVCGTGQAPGAHGAPYRGGAVGCNPGRATSFPNSPAGALPCAVSFLPCSFRVSPAVRCGCPSPTRRRPGSSSLRIRKPTCRRWRWMVAAWMTTAISRSSPAAARWTCATASRSTEPTSAPTAVRYRVTAS